MRFIIFAVLGLVLAVSTARAQFSQSLLNQMEIARQLHERERQMAVSKKQHDLEEQLQSLRNQVDELRHRVEEQE